jgi:hypothetical protein
MNRLAFAAAAALVVVVASVSGCATPCCFCYCGEVPTRGLLEASNEARPEMPVPSSVNDVVVARY